MITNLDGPSLYKTAAMQLSSWDNLTDEDRATYVAAIDAVDNFADPMARAEALHGVIGGLWGAPPWEEMQGPERAAYMFVAGTLPMPEEEPQHPEGWVAPTIEGDDSGGGGTGAPPPH